MSSEVHPITAALASWWWWDKTGINTTVECEAQKPVRRELIRENSLSLHPDYECGWNKAANSNMIDIVQN